MTPLVSIIMPVKNAAAFLPETLESIQRQSMKEWELIAVDDHSSDVSFDILQKASSNDPRIKLIKNEGTGITPALIRGYEQSTGESITRMDADDLMDEKKLERLSEGLTEGIIRTARVRYFRSDGPLGSGYEQYAQWLNNLESTADHLRERFKECVIPSPCWMMRRQDFESIGGFHSESYPEDYDLMFRMLHAGFELQKRKEVLHHWRDHSMRTSRNHPNYADNRFLDMKLKYFVESECSTGAGICLWGAGSKGKSIARGLASAGVEFRWVTSNQKKIGKEISRLHLSGPNTVEQGSKVILAVAAEQDQMEIRRELDDKEVTIFPFC